MRILVVEDDHLQARGIQQGLRSAISGAEVQVITTESEFRHRFDEIADTIKPDIVILDVMLRWADPAPEVPVPPPDVRRDGFFKAGLRLRELLKSDPRTQNIPAIVYTVLDERRLPGVDFVAKGTDFTELVRRVNAVMAPRP